MFSRGLLSCRVSPSDRGQPAHPAWSDRDGCPSCGQRFLPTVENPSAVAVHHSENTTSGTQSRVEVRGRECGVSREPCEHKLQDEEDVVVSVSSVSPSPSVRSSLTFVSSEASVCHDLDWLLLHDQGSTLLLSLCRVWSPTVCQRCVSCPLHRAPTSESLGQSPSARSPCDCFLGRVGSCAEEFSECAWTRDLLSPSSPSSPSCSDRVEVSTSQSSSSLRSSTSSWCASSEGSVEPPVPTSSARSLTTTTITATGLVGKPAYCPVFSVLSADAIGAVSDSQPAVGLEKFPERRECSLRWAASPVRGSVSQCPSSGELSHGLQGFDLGVGVSPLSDHQQPQSLHRHCHSLPSCHKEPSGLHRQGPWASDSRRLSSPYPQRALSHQTLLSPHRQVSLSPHHQVSLSPHHQVSLSPHRQVSLSPHHQVSLSPYQQGSQSPHQGPSHHQGSLSSPRGDSDSDAQIDSMSSSDLDHCEDLQPFELAQHLPDPQLFFLGDGPGQPATGGASADGLHGSVIDSSVNGHKVHMMSYQDFQQLPPMPEDCELPALWEDGGALGSEREGYSVGGSYGDGIHWGSFTDSSVKFLAEEEDVEDAKDTPSLEHRSTVIEQTLTEIYASPFPQLMYASSQSSSTNHKSQQRKLSFRTSESSDSNYAESPRDIADDSGENLDGREDRNAKEEAETLADDDGVARLREEPEERVRSTHDYHRTMKVSIARAAQKAVSGYRTCDDADSYVGARVKPTLILARAPPSPSGILRRTNKKTSAKVVHGSVRWADGKPPSLPPYDEAT